MNHEELKIALDLYDLSAAIEEASRNRPKLLVRDGMARQWRTTMTPLELKEVAAALIKTQ